MIFTKFCKLIATPGKMMIDPNCKTVPEKYRERLHRLIKMLQPEMGMLDKIQVSFVETAMEDITYVTARLNETCGGDIPDAIINELALNLYYRAFNKITEDEQSIIKVLAVYLCIQI